MTESQIASITKALGRIEKHLGQQDDRFEHLDSRFNHLDERLTGIDERLDNHVAGPGAKRTAATGGGVAAVVTATILGLFEGLKRLGS